MVSTVQRHARRCVLRLIPLPTETQTKGAPLWGAPFRSKLELNGQPPAAVVDADELVVEVAEVDELDDPLIPVQLALNAAFCPSTKLTFCEQFVGSRIWSRSMPAWVMQPCTHPLFASPTNVFLLAAVPSNKLPPQSFWPAQVSAPQS